MKPHSVCVIGNSHIVAIRDGWKEAGDLVRAFLPTYFAAPGNQFEALRLENDRLVPPSLALSNTIKTTGGDSYIDIKAFDGFLLVGLYIRIGRIADLYGRHRLAAHGGRHHELISRGVLGATVREIIRESAGFKTAEKIRAVSNAPVIVVPEPFPNPAIIKVEGERRFRESGKYGELLRDVFEQSMRDVFEPLGAKVSPQPRDTMQMPWFSRPEYSTGARQLWGRQYRPDEQEFLHMNAAYGVKVLQAAMPAFGLAM